MWTCMFMIIGEVNFDQQEQQQGGFRDKVFNRKKQQCWTQEANGRYHYHYLTFRYYLNLLQKDQVCFFTQLLYIMIIIIALHYHYDY